MVTLTQPSAGDTDWTTEINDNWQAIQGVIGTDMTTGSVLFSGASGVYSQDNSNFFWDDTNKRLGIGTAVPSNEIHTLASGSSTVRTQSTGSWSGYALVCGTSAINWVWQPTDTDSIRIYVDGADRASFNPGSAVINEGGAAYDFRVEGDTQTHLLFTDGSADRVGVGTSAPNADLDVAGNGVLRVGKPDNTAGSIQLYGGASTSPQVRYFDGGTERGRVGVTTGTTEIRISGTSSLSQHIVADSSGKISMGGSSLTNMAAGDLVLYGGSLVLKEITTPTADTNYGKIYTKTDNQLYFQDGAGTEAEVLDDKIVDAKGDILAATAADAISRLAVGSNDQILTADSAESTGLKWATPTGGSDGWVPISQVVASSDATVDFTSGIDSTYKAYAVVISNAVPATDGVQMYMRLSISGTFQAGTNYRYAEHAFTEGGGHAATGSSGTGQFPLTSNVLGNATGKGLSSVVYVFDPAGTSNHTYMKQESSFSRSNAQSEAVSVAGRLKSTSAVDGIRFLMSSGNVSTGTFTLYGIASP